MQTITLPVTTNDDMLAAMLRLIAAQGLAIEVDAIERPSPDDAERLLLSVELPGAVQPSLAAEFERLAAVDASVGVVTAGVLQGDTSDWLPPDPDAVYRPRGSDADTDDKRDEIDKQLLIVSRLGDRPQLADVARHLLKPLAGKGWTIDGDREAVLVRLAEEFADYRSGHLADAAARLLGGRHSHFPDMGEIYQALGRAARPGASNARKAA